MKRKILGTLLGVSLFIIGVITFAPQNAEASELSQSNDLCFTQGHWEHIWINGERRLILVCLGNGDQLCLVPCGPVIGQ